MSSCLSSKTWIELRNVEKTFVAIFLQKEKKGKTRKARSVSSTCWKAPHTCQQSLKLEDGRHPVERL